MGDNESTLALKPMGRIIQSLKQRVPLAPQIGPQYNKNFKKDNNKTSPTVVLTKGNVFALLNFQVGKINFCNPNGLAIPNEKGMRNRHIFIGFLSFPVYLPHQVKANANAMSSNVPFQQVLCPFERKAKNHRFCVSLSHGVTLPFSGNFRKINFYNTFTHENDENV